jgi:hypothetical protein
MAFLNVATSGVELRLDLIGQFELILVEVAAGLFGNSLFSSLNILRSISLPIRGALGNLTTDCPDGHG